MKMYLLLVSGIACFMQFLPISATRGDYRMEDYDGYNHNSHRTLYKKFDIVQLKWADGVPPKKNRLQVKWFYTSYRCDATVSFSEDNSTMYLTIDQLDWGMDVGQNISFYDGDMFLGWGVIASMKYMK